jgi:mannose-6-phosphate isomerase-like protein (cupin superfamily)
VLIPKDEGNMTGNPVVINLKNVDVQGVATRKLDFSICEFSDQSDERLIKLAYVRSTKEDRYSPTHRHNFDQVRYIVSGEIEYGPLKCGPGDCIYFPEGVFYGPTGVKTDRAENYTIQSQGPSWARLLTRAEAKEATAEIAKKGVLDREKGIVHWPDGKNQDSYEAMWELMTEEKLVYPSARFNGPCLLRSEHFKWTSWRGGEAAYCKHLAVFNECGPAVKLIKLEPGGRLFSGRSNHHRLALLVSGKMKENDTSITAGAAIYSAPSTEYPELSCETEAVLLLVQLQAKGGPPIDSSAS